MKIGNLSFRRRYSIAQIVVDIASLLALAYIAYIVYVCAQDIDRLRMLNHTDADLSALDWKPLIIWVAAGVLLCAFSAFLILKPKKMPKDLFVNENNASKYCGIIDTCVSCVRLVALIALSEICYLHMSAILMREVQFSTQLIIDALIIVCIIIFTRMRLTAVSDTEKEKAENDHENGKKRELTED